MTPRGSGPRPGARSGARAGSSGDLGSGSGTTRRGGPGRGPGAGSPPVEALRRIAYLLERGRAETYKVRAFRSAAEAIAGRPVEELAAMTPAALQALPGVGKTTAQVIAEASRGEQPSYLRKLEGTDLPALEGAAAELRDALQGDCHSHSDWSDGGSPIREMAEAARSLGHRYWALTDHSPRLTVAHGLNPERLRQQLEVVAELNEELAPFRILTGIEVDILEDGSLDQEEGLLAGLDVVVASVHSKLRMGEAEMTERMLRAIESPHTDILGHCTGRLLVGKGRPPSAFDAERVFEACARTGTAVEVNSRPERLDPPEPLLELALSLGCVVTVDTDAHAPGQLEWQRYGCAHAAKVGVRSDRVMNARPLGEFLDWTAGHAA
ncbi:MAG TPA: PHP domain-containing protein [Acidimicrobiales bacterium]|nr:PHP domain-containing protein [Acidimicrobiales bacterium]